MLGNIVFNRWLSGKTMIPLIAETFSSTTHRENLSLNFTSRLFNTMLLGKRNDLTFLRVQLKEVAYGKASYLVDLNLKGGHRSG